MIFTFNKFGLPLTLALAGTTVAMLQGSQFYYEFRCEGVICFQYVRVGSDDWKDKGMHKLSVLTFLYHGE